MSEFVFDWHKTQNSFLGWILVVLVTEMKDAGSFEEINERSNSFSDVELGITINGVAVDAEYFVTRLEEAFKSNAKREASRMVSELAPLTPLRDFTEKLEETLSGYDSAIRRHVEKLVKDQGIEVYEWEL